MTLSIAYFSCRKNPLIEWHFSSLCRETNRNFDGLRFIFVDFWAEEPGRKEWFYEKVPNELIYLHVSPKPSVWQGRHRLTKRNYFAQSNARNTAICLCATDWIVFADDLSWLAPGWLERVRLAQQENRITCGAFKKLKQMVVSHNGDLTQFESHAAGVDSRWFCGSDEKVVRINGGELYGCSIVSPVEAFLEINGFDEGLDAESGEDSHAGLMLEWAGRRLFYDRRLLQYESEEHHHLEPSFLRIIKPMPGEIDSSHWNLNMVRSGKRKTSPNPHFGPGGIRELRRRVLAGEPFPIPTEPVCDPRDGQPLSEM